MIGRPIPGITRGAAVLCAAIALGCSTSESPAPTLAGTWQVAIRSFNKGAISPSTFNVSVWPSGDSFIVAMPALTWTGGPTGASVAFNLPPNIVRFSTDTLTGFGESVFGIEFAGSCASVTISGHPNPSKDSLENAVVTIADTMVSIGGGGFACQSRWTGSATVSKVGSAGTAPAAPPTPNPVGSWLVSVDQLTSGALTPSPFTAVISSASQATIPTLTWTVNNSPAAYDSLDYFATSVDTVAFGMHRQMGQNGCQDTFFEGKVRADTMVGTVFVADTIMAPGPPYCRVLSYGTFRATR